VGGGYRELPDVSLASFAKSGRLSQMHEIRTSTVGRMAARPWWAICAGMLLGIVGGWVALQSTKPVYSSAASVLVQPVGGNDVDLPTEVELARSTRASVDAPAIAGLPARMAPASVEALPDTSVLVIRFEGATPEAAQAGARALADAYLTGRAASARSAIDAQLSAVTTKLGELNEQVNSANARIATLPSTSAEAASLRGTLTSLTTQIVSLTARANDLATTTVNPGRTIDDAGRPTEPVRPNAPRYLATGAGIGALLGAVAAIGRTRLSRLVRRGADVPRRAGVAVLAELPGDEAGIRPPNSPDGRAFNHLRNEVVAALGSSDRVILVTGASPGAASTIVAANLAAAFARADTEVALVGANVPEIGTETLTLSQIFDVADIPGLTDVLAGRTSLGRTLQRAARAPRLRIVTPGGTASAAGLLQSEGAGTVLNALRQAVRYVVVEAPSAAAGADAQSLARVADVVILVIETGRTRHAQVADAARQLRLVGTRLLGAVVQPPVVRAPAVQPPAKRTPAERTPVAQNTVAQNTVAQNAVTQTPAERTQPDGPQPKRAPAATPPRPTVRS
jgi:Mrp family chromosome partitioning ATPase